MAEHTHDLAQEVQEAIAAFQLGPIGDEGKFAWAARCAEELAEAVHAAATTGEGDREALKVQATKVATAAFDEFVVPYDVPGIGPITEAWLENAIRGAIPGLIETAFAKAA